MDKTIAPYTIYAESTPNPNTLKFVSNRWLVGENKSYEILPSQRVGGPSPLAEKLYNFPFVNGVYISKNYITITKNASIEWADVVMEIREFIKDYLNNGGVLINEDAVAIEDQELFTNKNENEDNVTAKKELTDFDKRIVEILNEYIKPAIESDGGAIDYHSFENGTVKVILRGSCSGCPSSTMTLKQGIESLLMNMLPEVKQVEAING